MKRFLFTTIASLFGLILNGEAQVRAYVNRSGVWCVENTANTAQNYLFIVRVTLSGQVVQETRSNIAAGTEFRTNYDGGSYRVYVSDSKTVSNVFSNENDPLVQHQRQEQQRQQQERQNQQQKEKQERDARQLEQQRLADKKKREKEAYERGEGGFYFPDEKEVNAATYKFSTVPIRPEESSRLVAKEGHKLYSAKRDGRWVFQNVGGSTAVFDIVPSSANGRIGGSLSKTQRIKLENNQEYQTPFSTDLKVTVYNLQFSSPPAAPEPEDFPKPKVISKKEPKTVTIDLDGNVVSEKRSPSKR